MGPRFMRKIVLSCKTDKRGGIYISKGKRNKLELHVFKNNALRKGRLGPRVEKKSV